MTFLITAVIFGPDLAAQKFADEATDPGASPVDESDVEAARQRVKVGAVMAAANKGLWRAHRDAAGAATVAFNRSAIDHALEAFQLRDLERAESLLRSHITHLRGELKEAKAGDDEDARKPDAIRADLDQARLFLGNVLLQRDQPTQAASVIAQVTDATPIDDAVAQLHGLALAESGKYAEAAEAFDRAYDEDTTILKWHALARRAHALAAAEQWEQALPVLTRMSADFPDYPRRHRILYQRARAFEALGRLDDAARAYQTAWYEFPHKPEGVKARADVERLAEAGHAPPALSRHDLFRRYRRLRINKHWPLAERLFLELKEQEATEDGHSAFEHEILMQLALNDYVPQNYAEALEWLEKLREAYENGHRAGIDRDLMYKYLSRTYSRLDRLDDSYDALVKQLEGRGAYTRKSETAEFFEDHARYGKAKEIYDTYYSEARKRGWHYTWILYKTGDFDQAYENLTRLAERSSGQRRAKYMYWAGRTLDRAGNTKEAVKVFTDLARAYELGYYGLQARNRLLDIRQRSAVDSTLVSKTRTLLEGSDEALRVMDEAAEKMDENVSSYTRDPRAIPRRADVLQDDGPASDVSVRSCDAETAAEEKYCKLEQGRLPQDTRAALESVLSPLSPLASIYTTNLPSDEALQAAALDDDDQDDVRELGDMDVVDAPSPSRDVEVAAGRAPRVEFGTHARIYWEGRAGSNVAFARAARGKTIGPVPDARRAYDDESYLGGLERAVDRAVDLFPALERVRWLRRAGLIKWSRWEMRGVSLEYRGIDVRGRPYSSPVELPYERWAYYIDNRRRETGLWGYTSDEKRFPIPDSSSTRRALLERQQEMHDREDELDQLILDAMKEVGDYHLVRRYTLGTGPWYRQSPTGKMRYKWMQAYPRAFPNRIIREATKNGMNPYLMWAIMTVESSYNPDSISPADAIGLMQVIPRTGIKVAEMLGDEDFGPFDLINEDVAIRHGAFYYSKLVDKFRGQELLAIAGYNGGPHRVAAWMDKRGDSMPMDEFVEEIPFTEARGYTKKVIRFLALYLRIYEGVDQLYIGQNMRMDYLPQPNF
jgi:soluble lytic murein transglycosylase-like protein/tetratricopeptide (TPR) repeat protein